MDLTLLVAGGEIKGGERVGIAVAPGSGEGERHKGKLVFLLEHVNHRQPHILLLRTHAGCA